MIKVAALTSGALVPSSRFRVRQHIDPLKSCGVFVREYLPRIDKYRELPFWPRNVDYRAGLPLFLVWQGIKVSLRVPGIVGSWRHQVTWLERQLVPGMVTLEPFLRRPLVFDVDDAIWLNPPFRSSAWRIAKRSTVLVAGNQYLADRFSPFAEDIRIVPTAVDTDRFLPRTVPRSAESGTFTVGWIGSSANLGFLQSLEEPLSKFLADHADARILIVADRPFRFSLVPADRVHFSPWSENTEVAALQAMDVGLMPLPDDDWSRGKCSYKMLQYLACGIPVAVSPVGMNREILSMGPLGMGCTRPDEWYETLSFFWNDRSAALRYGAVGRDIVERTFSRRLVTEKLAAIFRSLA